MKNYWRLSGKRAVTLPDLSVCRAKEQQDCGSLVVKQCEVGLVETLIQRVPQYLPLPVPTLAC